MPLVLQGLITPQSGVLQPALGLGCTLTPRQQPAPLQMPGGAERHGARTGRAVVAGWQQPSSPRNRCQAYGVLAAPGCNLLTACALCPRTGDQALLVSPGELLYFSVPQSRDCPRWGGARRNWVSAGVGPPVGIGAESGPVRVSYSGNP